MNHTTILRRPNDVARIIENNGIKFKCHDFYGRRFFVDYVILQFEHISNFTHAKPSQLFEHTFLLAFGSFFLFVVMRTSIYVIRFVVGHFDAIRETFFSDSGEVVALFFNRSPSDLSGTFLFVNIQFQFDVYDFTRCLYVRKIPFRLRC